MSTTKKRRAKKSKKAAGPHRKKREKKALAALKGTFVSIGRGFQTGSGKVADTILGADGKPKAKRTKEIKEETLFLNTPLQLLNG